MRKNRGFRLRHKLVRIFKWIILPRKDLNRCQRLEPPTQNYNPISKFFTLARFLRRGAKQICSANSGYIRIREAPVETKVAKPVSVPKGHLAVYLLKEAEKVYGFNHPGRIVIPCEVSEFEKVHMKIAAWDQCPRRRRKSRR
ncbi:hypothetical protein PRUPE_8G063100 [Prunus persica]|uniref:Uncharacterized protein n=1 Tax=Prunus persica TaxID=3760 RepID=M5VPG7_PRUPE|nr:auxin-responsive protein SAUR36 [Prunus persica]ONH90602.1 hypothetical protein PRUPE_8G063100 [Prunus persica]